MPKSRLRKDHKQKVVAYKKATEDKKKYYEKKMRELYEAQQQKDMDKQIAGGEVEHEKLEGLNVEDFQLDEPQLVDLSESNFGIVEGVTQPDQL